MIITYNRNMGVNVNGTGATSCQVCHVRLKLFCIPLAIRVTQSVKHIKCLYIVPCKSWWCFSWSLGLLIELLLHLIFFGRCWDSWDTESKLKQKSDTLSSGIHIFQWLIMNFLINYVDFVHSINMNICDVITHNNNKNVSLIWHILLVGSWTWVLDPRHLCHYRSILTTSHLKI